jgi:beta-glucoside operon transcriptional antiterminator
MKVIKTINNNTVCVLDSKGKELIVSGKGIGFGKKYGDPIDESQITKTYFITDSELQKKMISTLRDIPYEHIRVTESLIEHIKASIPSKLNESLLVTLSDHISFAIERQKDGMEFTNPLTDAIREAYPLELSLGEYCIEEIKKQLGVSLNYDEAGFIAMHIINARLDTPINDIYNTAKLINSCIEIAEYYYSIKLDRESAFYDRFRTHLKYLAQRILKGEPLPKSLSSDDDFVAMIKKTCNKHYKCALCIQEYILKTYGININEDELITLSIHLKKISSQA